MATLLSRASWLCKASDCDASQLFLVRVVRLVLPKLYLSSCVLLLSFTLFLDVAFDSLPPLPLALRCFIAQRHRLWSAVFYAKSVKPCYALDACVASMEKCVSCSPFPLYATALPVLTCSCQH